MRLARDTPRSRRNAWCEPNACLATPPACAVPAWWGYKRSVVIRPRPWASLLQRHSSPKTDSDRGILPGAVLMLFFVAAGRSLKWAPPGAASTQRKAGVAGSASTTPGSVSSTRRPRVARRSTPTTSGAGCTCFTRCPTCPWSPCGSLREYLYCVTVLG